jgi:hypothetical protein
MGALYAGEYAAGPSIPPAVCAAAPWRLWRRAQSRPRCSRQPRRRARPPPPQGSPRRPARPRPPPWAPAGRSTVPYRTVRERRVGSGDGLRRQRKGRATVRTLIGCGRGLNPASLWLRPYPPARKTHLPPGPSLAFCAASASASSASAASCCRTQPEPTSPLLGRPAEGAGRPAGGSLVGELRARGDTRACQTQPRTSAASRTAVARAPGIRAKTRRTCPPRAWLPRWPLATTAARSRCRRHSRPPRQHCPRQHQHCQRQQLLRRRPRACRARCWARGAAGRRRRAGALGAVRWAAVACGAGRAGACVTTRVSSATEGTASNPAAHSSRGGPALRASPTPPPRPAHPPPMPRPAPPPHTWPPAPPAPQYPAAPPSQQRPCCPRRRPAGPGPGPSRARRSCGRGRAARGGEGQR